MYARNSWTAAKSVMFRDARLSYSRMLLLVRMLVWPGGFSCTIIPFMETTTMAEWFDCCGGKGKHFDGCDNAPPEPRQSRRVKGTGNTPDHEHNYILVRTENAVIKDRGRRWNVTYRFYECITKGCPKPDKMEIERHPQ
jgi:hypothetical protein